jgi:hypothetical protein
MPLSLREARARTAKKLKTQTLCTRLIKASKAAGNVITQKSGEEKTLDQLIGKLLELTLTDKTDLLLTTTAIKALETSVTSDTAHSKVKKLYKALIDAREKAKKEIDEIAANNAQGATTTTSTNNTTAAHGGAAGSAAGNSTTSVLTTSNTTRQKSNIPRYIKVARGRALHGPLLKLLELLHRFKSNEKSLIKLEGLVRRQSIDHVINETQRILDLAKEAQVLYFAASTKKAALALFPSLEDSFSKAIEEQINSIKEQITSAKKFDDEKFSPETQAYNQEQLLCSQKRVEAFRKEQTKLEQQAIKNGDAEMARLLQEEENQNAAEEALTAAANMLSQLAAAAPLVDTRPVDATTTATTYMLSQMAAAAPAAYTPSSANAATAMATASQEPYSQHTAGSGSGSGSGQGAGYQGSTDNPITAELLKLHNDDSEQVRELKYK